MQAATQRLQIGLPRAGFATRDPWGLRSVLAILLLIGAVDAGSDWRERIGQALAPNMAGGPAATAINLDIWVTPPEYTGLAPIFLRPEITEAIRVPAYSAM